MYLSYLVIPFYLYIFCKISVVMGTAAKFKFINPFVTGTYIPRKEVVVEETIRATVIKPNQSIKLRARKETLDRDGNPRVTGEEWLVTKVGAYLPGAYEEVVDVVDAYVLTEKVREGEREGEGERERERKRERESPVSPLEELSLPVYANTAIAASLCCPLSP